MLPLSFWAAYLQGFEEGKDFGWLFAPNYDWITSSLGIPSEAS